MSLLSEEKIEALWQEHVLPGFADQQKLISPTVFARAIEAAALEAQKQEPVGKVLVGGYEVELYKRMPEGAELYSVPVAQPGMVMVPREVTEAMEYAFHNGRTSTHQRFRERYANMIAAVEVKK